MTPIFSTRPRARYLENLFNGRARDLVFLKIKSGMRPGRDRESHALRREHDETLTRLRRDQESQYESLANLS